MSLHDAMAHAAMERPIDWVQGIRTAAGTWPTSEMPVGTFPNSSNLRAARLLHFLAPPYNGQGSVHRTAWMESVLRGFSVWGFFERHVQFGQWIASVRVLEAYPFDATNISYSQAMQWVHFHSVPTGSMAAMELHSFTASWHNLAEGLQDPTGQNFSGHDIENAESVLRLDIGRVTTWATFWHGPIRPGVTTDFPRCPEVLVRREREAQDAEMPAACPKMPVAPQMAPEDGEILPNSGPPAGPDDLDDSGAPRQDQPPS
ncbi:hypothetical protein K438DRAFT_1991271 [Mycena galopus ATCC 62051]|nr:hypothetical protein K438DRAFT_1991271 [Mycena galopus ATCC 62051]